MRSAQHDPRGNGRDATVYYPVVLIVMVLVASLIGFLGIAGMSAQNSWVLGVVATVFLAIALLAGRHGGFVTHRSAVTSQSAEVQGLRRPSRA